MNRRSFLRSSTALLATTMLCPVSGLSHNKVLVGAQRAQMQVRATYGRSSMIDALGDIRALQAAQRSRALQASWMPMFGDPRLPEVRTITIAGKAS